MWPDGEVIFPIFGHLLQWKFAQWYKKSQSMFRIWANTKYTIEKLPNTLLKFAKVAKFCRVWLNYIYLTRRIWKYLVILLFFESSKLHWSFCWPNCMSWLLTKISYWTIKRIDRTEWWPKIGQLFSVTMCTPSY